MPFVTQPLPAIIFGVSDIVVNARVIGWAAAATTLGNNEVGGGLHHAYAYSSEILHT